MPPREALAELSRSVPDVAEAPNRLDVVTAELVYGSAHAERARSVPPGAASWADESGE